MRGITTLTDRDNDNIRYHKVINHVIWKDKFKPLIEHSHTNVENIHKPVTRKLKKDENI